MSKKTPTPNTVEQLTARAQAARVTVSLAEKHLNDARAGKAHYETRRAGLLGQLAKLKDLAKRRQLKDDVRDLAEEAEIAAIVVQEAEEDYKAALVKLAEVTKALAVAKSESLRAEAEKLGGQAAELNQQRLLAIGRANRAAAEFGALERSLHALQNGDGDINVISRRVLETEL